MREDDVAYPLYIGVVVARPRRETEREILSLIVVRVRVLVLGHDAPRCVLGGLVDEGAIRGERGRFVVGRFARAPAPDLLFEARECDCKPLFADEEQCKVQVLWLEVVPAVLQSEVVDGEGIYIVERLDGERGDCELGFELN